MLTAIKENKLNLYEVDGVKYLLLSGWNDKVEVVIEHYDAILITADKLEDFENLVHKIRTHQSQAVFLKPVFYKFPIASTFKAHTDGKFQDLLSNEVVRQITLKIKELPSVIAHSSEQQIALHLLQFLFTRAGKLHPSKNRISKTTYQYPFIDLFYKGEEFNALQNLKKLEQEGWIEAKIKDRVQLCQDCNDGFLAFKETCPKCSSINVESFDVIHHFVCAHVAPESDYKNPENDQMSCPKCDKHLRHIGIDYDKPSSVYHCKSCDHDFQNAAVVAECHSCDKKNELPELVEIDINNYKLTMKGVAIAKNGAFGTREAQVQSQEVIFHELIRHEIARKTQGYVVKVLIKSPFFAMLDKKYKASFWEEIKSNMQDYTPFDQHIIIKDASMEFLLLDKTEAECVETCTRMKFNLSVLLEDNLGGNVNVEIEADELTAYFENG